MNDKQTAFMFSKNTDEWTTPDDVFQELDAEFHFTLDPCATDENHKTDLYFTKEQDGLSRPCGGYIVFCNPPYSNIKEWVKKAYTEATQPHTIVVLLIPARTGTRYFHDYILHRSEIRFFKGRIKFSDAKYGAPFPSLAVIFRGPGM